MVGGAEHTSLTLQLLRPLFGLAVAALLEGIAHLDLEDVADAELQLCGESADGSAGSVAAHFVDYGDGVALSVYAKALAGLLKDEDVVKHRIESLEQKVRL